MWGQDVYCQFCEALQPLPLIPGRAAKPEADGINLGGENSVTPYATKTLFCGVFVLGGGGETACHDMLLINCSVARFLW